MCVVYVMYVHSTYLPQGASDHQSRISLEKQVGDLKLLSAVSCIKIHIAETTLCVWRTNTLIEHTAYPSISSSEIGVNF